MDTCSSFIFEWDMGIILRLLNHSACSSH